MSVDKINPLVTVLQSYLQKNDCVVFGYLFGSYFNNTQDIYSDIDVALYLKNTSLDTKLQITYELSKLTKKDIDLIVPNEIKNIYLLEDILNNSILLKDDKTRIDFELIKEHDILDYKEFRRMIDAA